MCGGVGRGEGEGEVRRGRDTLYFIAMVASCVVP